MLISLKEYLTNRGVCTLAEISNHFNVSPDAMRGMLSHWVRKGVVVADNSGCQKGCFSCAPEQLEIYRWQSSEKLIPHCSVLE